MGIKPRASSGRDRSRYRARGDRSNGYEDAAEDFLAARSKATGAAAVDAWARRLPPAAAVLDLGCGSGVPITSALIEAGLSVWAIDAAPSLVASFAARFPDIPVACESVQDSTFFGRQFDGIVAWGLVFLLPARDQVELIRKVGDALDHGGRFLFTAPAQKATWTDILTGRPSRSLGATNYRRHLAAAGLRDITEYDHDGSNHYYDATRRPT